MIHTEPAWAKLNLTLDILGKRPDGYHDLRMVMQSIDLKDTVTLQEEDTPGIRVASSCRFLPCDETNIAAKAILRFFENTGLPCPGFSRESGKGDSCMRGHGRRQQRRGCGTADPAARVLS